jgi:hypothetical protein
MSAVVAFFALYAAFRQMSAAVETSVADRRATAMRSLHTIELEWIRAPLAFDFPIPDTPVVTRTMGEARAAVLFGIAKTPGKRWWLSESRTFWTPENRLAYELGLRLERLGVACLFGALPLEWVLTYFGHALIEDWALAKGHVRSLRNMHRETLMGTRQIRRRHAEWLSLIACLWVDAQSQSRMRSSRKRRICARVQELMAIDVDVMSPEVRRQVRALIKSPSGAMTSVRGLRT